MQKKKKQQQQQKQSVNHFHNAQSRVGHWRSPAGPGKCQELSSSTNHGSLARFGEYHFHIQNILFKTSVTFYFPL